MLGEESPLMLTSERKNSDEAEDCSEMLGFIGIRESTWQCAFSVLECGCPIKKRSTSSGEGPCLLKELTSINQVLRKRGKSRDIYDSLTIRSTWLIH